jgi:hypothetical protein
MDHSEQNKKNYGKKNWNKKNDKRGNNDKKERKVPLTPEEIENQQAIRAHKLNTPECPMCKKPVTEISSALADKVTGEPVHFDCVLRTISERENLLPNQKITYIGQGRFAVITSDNPQDLKNFQIVRIIEWEDREKTYQWRSDIAGLYSQVK